MYAAMQNRKQGGLFEVKPLPKIIKRLIFTSILIYRFFHLISRVTQFTQIV